MSETFYTRLVNAQQAKMALGSLYQRVKPYLMAEHQFDVRIKPETRSNAQNRRLWAMLGDVSKHVVWHGQLMNAEDWKHVFTAALKKSRVCPGIDGGFVVLGQPTSKMTRAEMSELQDLIEAFGAEKGVKFQAPEYESEDA